MNKIQFDILRLIKENNTVAVDELARELFKTEEQISYGIKDLTVAGYLDQNRLTDEGVAFLEKHRIDNAVILAAGLSSRFVPLNYEMPKGLLKVKGEPLIERQIKQLREKGISEIVIVVGYMAEKFDYLKEKYGVVLVEATDYKTRNNHASVYAARKYLKNTIITSSDLYFTQNIFQTYAYDSYYCTVYANGKTAERGITTDDDDRITNTFYGDRCYDVWITLGYAFFSRKFSENMIDLIESKYLTKESANMFWADIQDKHLDKLYMYAKRCPDNVIYEFDSLEELRDFDDTYIHNSGSKIMKSICKLLGQDESNIVGLESLKSLKFSMFKFRCKEDMYICDTEPDETERVHFLGRSYYQCRDFNSEKIKLFKMDKTVRIGGRVSVDTSNELNKLYNFSKEFKDYHERALPLCAAENVISPFANLPLAFGFQERYIMNNTYSFNMNDNFIGCEKLFPFYQMLSETCERIFGAKYTDPRPFTGMHCIDMITKTLCVPGDKMMILDKEHGGHASVKPVVERLGVKVYSAPYDLEANDLDYKAVNEMVEKEGIGFILLAPSDLIKPLKLHEINTEKCVLLWDCSQLMGMIAAGLCDNPLKTMRNIVMFGGTHKTFPGPASGLIMTNEKRLHDLMETEINPKFLRHSQMHQKISLLFALIEFEKFGTAYISHMVHCSNYLGEKLRGYGLDIADIDGTISATHQIFIRCSKECMDRIYDNAYKCEVTLNKKHKELFHGYGIRLGTQEIARYDWNDDALDKVAEIVFDLTAEHCDVAKVKEKINSLPPKQIKFAFDGEILERFQKLMG